MMKREIKIGLPCGLVLRGARYEGGPKTPALCIPGLTRNAADFEDCAPMIAATGRDVVALSMRGRGASDRDPDYRNYAPETYRDDIIAVLDQLAWQRAVFVGTSLGGIITMLTAEIAPDRIRAAIINDVGPEISPAGVERIVQHLNATAGAPPAADLDEAAERAKDYNAVAFPQASEAFWRAFAKRTHHQQADGAWVSAFDKNIVRALSENGAAPDLWPGFRALGAQPLLVVRGALSDLLTPEIVAEMRNAIPQLQFLELPQIGHAPMLSEPAAKAAIAAFLADID